jgi:hypothetical protein
LPFQSEDGFGFAQPDIRSVCGSCARVGFPAEANILSARIKQELTFHETDIALPERSQGLIFQNEASIVLLSEADIACPSGSRH